MDDSLFGKRNKRGDWAPNRVIEYAPVFTWPAKPFAFLKWFFGFPGFLFPWTVTYAAFATIMWLYLTPSMETMKTFEPGWIAYVFARNTVIVLLWVGFFHLRLYMQRRQGTNFKYNGQWPSTSNDAFLFKNQNIDNLIWTFASAVPFWTAYEALTLWAFANGYIPYVDAAEHPIYFVLLMLAVPLFRELHFYCVHRLIHWPPLYRTVHKLHHNNVNPGPWSGLAMHPVEHLLYFSGVLIHWVVPSHPIHAVFQLAHAALSPGPGHAGFDKIEVGEGGMDLPCYDHYLHHKYFECNYADNGVFPVDKLFGTFHDGTPESQERMDRRFMAQAKKAAEKAERKKRRSTVS